MGKKEDGEMEAGRGIEVAVPVFSPRSKKQAKRQAKVTALAHKEARATRGLEYRLQHADSHTIGGLEKGGNSVIKIDNPLRIDKLLNAGAIDETQHHHGMQIIALWNIANKPLCGSMQYSDLRLVPNIEGGQIGRMTAEDQFYRTMMYLSRPHVDHLAELRRELIKTFSRRERRSLIKQMEIIESVNKKAHKRSHDFIVSICFDEMGVLETAKILGVAINDAVDCSRRAFDALGEALAKMRSYRKDLQKRSDAAVSDNLRSIDTIPPVC
jgi:hypothetical protein